MSDRPTDGEISVTSAFKIYKQNIETDSTPQIVTTPQQQGIEMQQQAEGGDL
jgi:hypothetical protein